jgi:cobalt-zinc-cadmium resistance protein CzcA
VSALVEFALRRRWLVVVLLGVLLLAGVLAFRQLNIEAYPDPVPPLVEVVTQNPGQSAEEIERYVTIPIEVQLAGIPHVKSVRTISLFGLSDVKVQFTYDFSYDEAEQRVINRLSQLNGLPPGVQPQISPESPIGEIYRYRVVGPKGYSVTDLKTIQDWILQRRFKAVPGVIDVTGWGGKTKTYDVRIDQNKLMAYGLTLPQVVQVVSNSNINVGGQTIDIGEQSAIVRGIGLIHSPDQLRRTMLKTVNGVPVLLQDVATIEQGNQPRLGIAGENHDSDIVEGIVLMHRGEQSMPTIRAVKAEVDKINASHILPAGVRIQPIYDRSGLISLTTRTVLHNMVEGMLLIFVVQWLFLGSFRSAVIVAATIPFALSVAVLIMVLRGESANLLSVGAIDFGLVVDATVIMVEAIFRHLAESEEAGIDPATAHGLAGRMATIVDGAHTVGRSIFFAAAIIVVSFLPLFLLTGVEGHIFGPMARTYAYAIAGGLIATFTVSPALSALLLPVRLEEADTWLLRRIRGAYTPICEFALSNRALTLGLAAVVFAITGFAAANLGVEFLPHLEEGNFWIRATLPVSSSLAAGEPYVAQMREVMLRFPEVERVVSQHGRPDDGTDATGFFNAEFFVPLKPSDEWPKGMTKAKLTDELSAALTRRFPGVDFNFSQNIQDNVEEAASGVKGENSAKLFGGDLDTLQATADRIKGVMAKVAGVTDLEVFSSLGQPTVRIDVDRDRAARYGLAPGDINTTVQAAIGGQQAGSLYQTASDRNYPIIVRLGPSFRQSIPDLENIMIGAPNPNGTGVVQIPLKDVATVRLVSGASFIYRENEQRYVPIKFSVRGRDLGGAVLEAQRRVAQSVRLPAGYHLEWVGELGDLQNAIDQLRVAVPLSLALIALLLYLNFSSVAETLLAASVLPMVLTGGIFALALTGTPLSVSAAIGFIALFGISIMNGIIVLTSFNQLIGRGVERRTAIFQACQTQLRPVSMTCVAACVGLVPAALSTGIGSQVQKPLALVVVGGAAIAPAFVLLVLPVLIDLFGRGARRKPVAAPAPAPPVSETPVLL